MTQETTRILEHFGYIFEQRGVIAVKGKGDLMTYYIIGKKPDRGPGDVVQGTTVIPHRLVLHLTMSIVVYHINELQCNSAEFRVLL